MVMPRAFSSGAASIWSYALASPPNFVDSTVVIAAVRVVLPWSTWPMVPTLTCGLVRSNLPFAIFFDSEKSNDHCAGRGAHSNAPRLSGALGGNRTRDLSLTKGVLYH